jgi:hypothetical protein
VDGALGDAWQLYRLLFRRSVAASALVFAVVGIFQAAAQAGGLAVAIVAGLIGLAAPVFLQGSLVEIVRNIHEGQQPEEIGDLFRRARSRFWPLFGGSLLYGLGVGFGLVLFVVPGLIVGARWCLMAPLIMLQGRGVLDSRRESARLVRGRTGSVLGVLILGFGLTLIPSVALALTIGRGTTGSILLSSLSQALVAPFQAHLLTVIYYRLTDPLRPVIHESVEHWQSVWEGA